MTSASHFSVFGVRISAHDKRRLIETLFSFLRGSSARAIATANPEILLQASRDTAYRSALNSFDLVTIDGFGLLALARMLRRIPQNAQRMTGVDCARVLLEQAVQDGLRVCILIPRDSFSTPDRIRNALRHMHPGIRISVVTEADDTAHAIASRNPDVLFVTFGAPRQEQWIAANIHRIPTLKVAIGVGGTFDFLSGTIKRAPVWMQRIGLEWIWRLLLEPKRLGRIVRAVIIFPFAMLLHRD